VAVDQLYKEVGRHVGIGKKAIEQWFDRQTVPPEHVFNIGIAFGVSIAWLGGASDDKTPEPSGLYDREMDRQRLARRA
jgi:hypothetical protein